MYMPNSMVTHLPIQHAHLPPHTSCSLPTQNTLYYHNIHCTITTYTVLSHNTLQIHNTLIVRYSRSVCSLQHVQLRQHHLLYHSPRTLHIPQRSVAQRAYLWFSSIKPGPVYSHTSSLEGQGGCEGGWGGEAGEDEGGEGCLACTWGGGGGVLIIISSCVLCISKNKMQKNVYNAHKYTNTYTNTHNIRTTTTQHLSSPPNKQTKTTHTPTPTHHCWPSQHTQSMHHAHSLLCDPAHPQSSKTHLLLVHHLYEHTWASGRPDHTGQQECELTPHHHFLCV